MNLLTNASLDAREAAPYNFPMDDPLLCAVPTCPLPKKAKGYCNKHYQRWYKLGDPLAGGMPRNITPLERVLFKVIKSPGGCWLWTDGKDKDGYGKLKVNGKSWRAHIFSYTIKYGPVPDGLVLDHFVCNNPPCVNPDHVRPETSFKNSWVPGNKAYDNHHKTHCHRGHEFTPQNTYVFKTPYGMGRECRTCRPINAALRKSRISLS